jgi:hypothetical protein
MMEDCCSFPRRGDHGCFYSSSAASAPGAAIIVKLNIRNLRFSVESDHLAVSRLGLTVCGPSVHEFATLL